MIYTLTLSPAIDVTYSVVGELKTGLNRARSFALTAGGKGINAARAISREAELCGARADMCALFPAGGIAGDMLSRILEREKIPCERVEIAAECRVLSLIHIRRCRRSTLCRSRWSPYH